MSQSFRALGVSAVVEQELASRGITEAFPIQELALPDALAGLHVLAKSPTGSGKTLWEDFDKLVKERVRERPLREPGPRAPRKRGSGPG